MRSLGLYIALDIDFYEELLDGSLKILGVIVPERLYHRIDVLEADEARPNPHSLNAGRLGHEHDHGLLLVVHETVHIER